jgi:hypothetical protein
MNLPSGGPHKLDPAIAEMMLAHIEVFCAPDGSKLERDAARRRDELARSLDDRQRSLAGLLARSIERICSREPLRGAA